jgi:hypothetical protein
MHYCRVFIEKNMLFVQYDNSDPHMITITRMIDISALVFCIVFISSQAVPLAVLSRQSLHNNIDQIPYIDMNADVKTLKNPYIYQF